MIKPIVRKIQLTGGSTYIISLPKSWVKEHSLKPGDEIEIRQDKQLRLILSPRSSEADERKEKIITLNCSKPDLSFVIREIISYYMAGYSLVTVSCSKFTADDRETIKDVIRKRLLGAEVIDENANSLMIQFLVNEKDLSLTKSISRAFNISYNMLRDSMDALWEGDEELSKEISDRDDDVDRFYFYTVRQLSLAVEYSEILENEGYNLTQLINIFSVAKSIERISDHSVRILQQLSTLKKLEDKRVYDHGKTSAEFYKTSINAFFNKDGNIAHDVIKKEYDLLGSNSSISQSILSSQVDPKKTGSLLIIMDSLRRAIRYSIDIAEATIDLLAKQNEPTAELTD
ncbi:phosphate signaling complex PhoU family protein [Stygiolobus caldivivus]|uniref:SpoVT-AbrB domain-containing protein n=1 Tax=Stygiolobus caldivivus TaxID=2824673 RepID=A0A8D5ZKH4_9CREN|nr:phosphate uptake regulator PhoU [Stygiolobus caldivivus]BCU71385.1 hypothetical protein KN1_26820 [Stygiolobus caldivivus]